MQISRHWRLNSTRYRMQGERFVAYFDGQVLGESFSLQPGRAPDPEWVDDMLLKKREIIRESKAVAGQMLLAELGILIQGIAVLAGVVLQEFTIYEDAA